MTETLFFDASSNYNPRLSVQTRNDVDANERKTVGDVADRPERNCGRKNTVHLALNVDRDDTRDFEKSRQIRCSSLSYDVFVANVRVRNIAGLGTKTLYVAVFWEVLCGLLKYHQD